MENNCHGNHTESQVTVDMYGRPMKMYQYSTGASAEEPINTFRRIYPHEDRAICVSCDQNIHYNSVVNPNTATIGEGLSLLGLQSSPC